MESACLVWTRESVLRLSARISTSGSQSRAAVGESLFADAALFRLSSRAGQGLLSRRSYDRRSSPAGIKSESSRRTRGLRVQAWWNWTTRLIAPEDDNYNFLQADPSIDSEVSSEPDTLELNAVTKVYNWRTVVDQLSLQLHSGEIVGLLGPNGAGKSTAFGMLVGREMPSQGRICLGGTDITCLALDKRARLGIAYLPQEASVFRGLTVRENLLLVLQETGVPAAHYESRIQKLLRDFRLEHLESSLGKVLSGGERRRTELARALAANCASGGPPRFLLVDEPFAGVDPIGVQEIQGLLRHLSMIGGMGILITDHNVIETLRICDRAYMMYGGKAMASGSPAQLYADRFVQERYLGNATPHQVWLPGMDSQDKSRGANPPLSTRGGVV